LFQIPQRLNDLFPYICIPVDELERKCLRHSKRVMDNQALPIYMRARTDATDGDFLDFRDDLILSYSPSISPVRGNVNRALG
jgi:hypothetical protein